MTKRKNQIVPLVNVNAVPKVEKRYLPIEKRNSVKAKLNRIYAFFTNIYIEQSDKLENIRGVMDTFDKIDGDFTIFINNLKDISDSLPESDTKNIILGYVKKIQLELSKYINEDEPTTGELDER